LKDWDERKALLGGQRFQYKTGRESGRMVVMNLRSRPLGYRRFFNRGGSEANVTHFPGTGRSVPRASDREMRR
jgi:hypothetical protein